jgi:dTDP-4-dehydrorhamnose reductase
MRIVVLGAGGLLGSTLVPHLRSCGHEILCAPPRADAGQGNLIDAGRAHAILDELRPEVIVNLAALTDVDECERNPQAAYLTNVRIVENIATWMRASSNTCHLVQISTDQVYDGLGPHGESDITLKNYYAFSKYAGELAAATAAGTIVRTNFFGPSRCQGRTSLSDWLMHALTNNVPITVFDDVRFSPLSLLRLVQMLELVIRSRRQGTYNLGSRDGMSKADFAVAFASALNLPTLHMKRGTSETALLKAYRPKDMRMDSSLFERTFDVELPTLMTEIQSMKGCYRNET